MIVLHCLEAVGMVETPSGWMSFDLSVDRGLGERLTSDGLVPAGLERLAVRYELEKGYGERAVGFEERRGLEYIDAFREALEERLHRSRHKDASRFVALSVGQFQLPL